MSRRPNFIIIGAMKSATSTLHEQLAAQPGIFMSTPKEPNFFSNDEEYDKGLGWYEDLFAAAQPDDLCGESSTHYTKLPTYPHTLERIQQHVPDAKFIYMMRHPINRLVSHYIHEWTQRRVSTDINSAVDLHPELIAYSQYSMQIKPFLETFGSDRVLPIFFERFCTEPEAELERVCRFIGYSQTPTWVNDQERHNVSSERLRKSAWRDFIVEVPVLSTIRRMVVPKGVRNWVKSWWTMKEKPQLNPDKVEYLQGVFDEDLAILGTWLGVDLSCETFKTIALAGPHDWMGWPTQDLKRLDTVSQLR